MLYREKWTSNYENTLGITTLEIAGFSPAIKIAMRNPMNSWDISDSYTMANGQFILGDNDEDLCRRLIQAGGEHRKFLRQIHVWMNINEPRYWWSEFDTYHFNTKNSTSTMHKLLNAKKDLTLDMFLYCPEDEDIAQLVVDRLNHIRDLWLTARDMKDHKGMNYCLLRAKRILLEGFLQLRTVDTSYEEIRNMYHQRKHHRLTEEWIDTFCKWVETLPYFDIFIK
jgi:hypothetical protein